MVPAQGPLSRPNPNCLASVGERRPRFTPNPLHGTGETRDLIGRRSGIDVTGANRELPVDLRARRNVMVLMVQSLQDLAIQLVQCIRMFRAPCELPGNIPEAT